MASFWVYCSKSEPTTICPAAVLDCERETTLDEVLAGLEIPSERFPADLGRIDSAEVIDLNVNGARVTLIPTASSCAERFPNMRESACFLDLADQVMERFHPRVLLTCGGHRACLELIRRSHEVGRGRLSPPQVRI
jgi:hypothetical protein